MSLIVSDKELLRRERLEDARARRTEARERAARLEAQADVRHRRNQAEHMRGEHVGTRADVTGCLDCKLWGDLPLLGREQLTPEQTEGLRSQLLEWNIAATVEAMRSNAVISLLELELTQDAEVDE